MKLSWTPLASKLAVLFIALVLAIVYVLIYQRNWPVLTAIGTLLAAIGTILAVVWAIYHQGILTYLRRPKLHIMPFEMKPPYFRPAEEFDRRTRRKMGIGYYVNILLENTGETVAIDCQPVLIAMGRKDGGKWRREENWIPQGLKWSLEGPEEKDLIPHRPYLFSLGHVSTTNPDKFFISTILQTTGQPSIFDPGEYWFEVKVFAANAHSKIIYCHVHWYGGCTDNFDVVKTKISISVKDHAP